MVCDDDVSVMGESKEKHTDALLVASNEIGLEENAERVAILSYLMNRIQEKITTQG
jgi:hypothetical protein